MHRGAMPKTDNNNTELREWHCCSIFINKFETNRISFANVCFVEFEQVNFYLRKLDVHR